MLGCWSVGCWQRGSTPGIAKGWLERERVSLNRLVRPNLHTSQFLEELEQLKAEHELLRGQCSRYEGQLCSVCARTGEPLPPGLAPL